MAVRFRDRRLWLGVQMQKDVRDRQVQEVRTQMVVGLMERRLWLEVQMQKDVSGQASTGGRDADGCEVQG